MAAFTVIGNSRPLRPAALLLAIVGALAAGAGMASCDPDDEESAGGGSAVKTKAPPPEKIRIKDRTYTLELARDDAARTRGMGGRTSVPEDGGMLFVFPDSQKRSFWMRDCTIDLDIIFLDPLGFVTAVHHMPAEPPRRADETECAYLGRLKGYPSISPAQFAIELRSGELEHLGVKPNQKIEADWKRIAKLAK